jgi:hypothetical protein
VATTINATTPRVGFRGVRCEVVKLNRFWPNTASIRLVAPNVKLKKVAAMEVLGWDPDQGDTEVLVGHSQTVNFAVVRSNPLSGGYPDPTDFLGGELTDLELAGAGIQLGKIRTTVDFDSYSVGGLPGDFTQVSTAGAWALQQEAGGNRYLRGTSNSGQNRTFVTYDVLASHVNLVAQVKMRFHTADYSGGGIVFRVTGSGATLKAVSLELRIGFNRFIARRYPSATSEVYLGDVYMGGVTPANDGHWYYLKGKIEGTNLYGKCWRDDDAEPTSWTLVASQSDVPGPGEVGLIGYSRASSGGNVTFDDMSFESIPTKYKLSGEWISERNPLLTVDRYSSSIMTWTESVPANTTLSVECQRDVGAPWLACVNGEPVPGFEFDDGVKTDNLRFRVALSTTDDLVTPEFSDLAFEFIRLDWDKVEISINGEFALGSRDQISHWGQKEPNLPSVLVTYDDIYAQTQNLFWLDVRGSLIPVTFGYDGVEIDSIFWYAQPDPAFLSDYRALMYWVCIEDAKKGEALVEWACLDRSPFTGAECEWSLIEFAVGIHATGWYWVATQVFNEFSSSMLVGEGVLNEFVSSLLANGYKRNEFVQSMVVQGAKINEFVSSLLAAQEFKYEFVQSEVIGNLELGEFKASLLIYGVSKDGAIFVNVIDDETYQALIDAGIVFS